MGGIIMANYKAMIHSDLQEATVELDMHQKQYLDRVADIQDKCSHRIVLERSWSPGEESRRICVNCRLEGKGNTFNNYEDTPLHDTDDRIVVKYEKDDFFSFRLPL